MTVHVVGAAIVDGARCLVARRGAKMRDSGKWEFPGGKVEPGESEQEALVREIREELGVTVTVGPRLGRGIAGNVVLDVFITTIAVGQPRAIEHDALSWVTAPEVAGLDWAAADVPVLDALVATLEKATAVGRSSPHERNRR